MDSRNGAPLAFLHDIEITFPGASYRAFFLAYRRAQRWLPVGTA